MSLNVGEKVRGRKSMWRGKRNKEEGKERRRRMDEEEEARWRRK